MKRKLLLNTVTSLLMQVVTLVCGFVLPRLILEHYGSEVNGLTQSIKQFLSVISLLELGVGQVIQSALYRPLAEKNNAQISKILASGGKFFRRIALVLLAYVTVLAMLYPGIAASEFEWGYTVVLILAISIHSFAQYLFGVLDSLLLNADQRGYVQYGSQIVAVLLNTLLSVAAIRMGQSIQMVKLMSAVVFLLRPVAVRLYIRRHYTIDRRIRYDGEPIRQKWNGIAQHISAVVLEGTDTIVLTLLSTLSNVSIYTVYFMVIGGIKQLYQALTAGLQSAVGTLWAKQDLEKLRGFFGTMEAGLHLLTVFLFSCTGILIVPFVQVYTQGLTDADYIRPGFAAVLVLAYWIRCVRTPYNIMILAGGHYKQTQTCHITAAALNLILSVLLVPVLGLVGIAIGTLIAFGFQTLWMIVYDSRNLLRWPLGKTLRQLAVDILTAAVIIGATSAIELHQVSYLGWFAMAVKVALIALAVTAAAAVLLCRESLKPVFSRLRKNKE